MEVGGRCRQNKLLGGKFRAAVFCAGATIVKLASDDARFSVHRKAAHKDEPWHTGCRNGVKHCSCAFQRRRLLATAVIAACDVMNCRRQVKNATGPSSSLLTRGSIPDVAIDQRNAIPPSSREN